MLIQEVTILSDVFILAINNTMCIIDHKSTLEKKVFEDLIHLKNFFFPELITITQHFL